MNRELLSIRLEKVFGATATERRVVVRQAGDLYDSGKYRADHDSRLTVDVIIANLSEAPDDYDLVERWNWWIGAMDLAHEGYQPFLIRRLDGGDNVNPPDR
ncbi:MAG: hypothetical protein ABEH65_05460 [Halobacteriales archaeon]